MRFVVAMLALLACASAVHAKELPESIRRMADRAFLEGRLDDLDDILTAAEEPIDRLPLLVRDTWWRMAGRAGVRRAASNAGDALIMKRLEWLKLPEASAWPVPRDGEADPYPILTALIQDRVRREWKGHEGLPQDGPLKALAGRLDKRREKRTIWFLDRSSSHMMSVAYRGVSPHPDQVTADREAEDLRARNGLLAALALLGFLLVPTLIAGVAFRGAKADPSQGA